MYGGYPQRVPNYLVWALLSLLCCWPLSIFAIVYAAQVNGKVSSGDIAGAIEASNKAKMWCWISFGVGFVVQTLNVLVRLGGR